jgi:hypothetical protein
MLLLRGALIEYVLRFDDLITLLRALCHDVTYLFGLAHCSHERSTPSEFGHVNDAKA